MTYHHLNESERNQIQGLLQSGMSLRRIAHALDRSPSTISDELHRNGSGGGYFALTAHLRSKERRTHALEQRALDREEPMRHVEKCLRERLSPEEIVGRLRLEKVEIPSLASLYAWIRDDQSRGGELHQFLRRAGKAYRSRYGSKSGGSAHGIKNRISIEKRPDVVTRKNRLGDFEGDTVFGARHQGVILTLVDRKSRFAILEKCSSKQSSEVGDAIIRGLGRTGIEAKTVTLDNGKEFAEHERVTEATGAPIYFCHPMSPQERGCNENLNGLIREFLPKGVPLSDITAEQLLRIEQNLNKRPRKCLGYLSPDEVIQGKKVIYRFAA